MYAIRSYYGPLFDGVMTNVEVQPGGNGSAGTVTITGEDLTRVMDTQDWSGLPFPAMPIEARVALLCAKYARITSYNVCYTKLLRLRIIK